jgi:hypothetical protein
LILDKNIALIQDAFYASQYTIRLFSDHKDLQPTLTLHDILPKRPQLQSEIKPVNYPSVSVNLDTLVAALQKPEPVTVNWSLPNDSRGYPLQSYMVGFSRKNCTAIQRWPNCSKRSEQFNEYLISKKFEGNNTVEDVITPNTLLPASSKTFESRLRLFALDNLGRPLEVSIGMNYQK